MKLFIKLLVLFVILALAGPFFLKKPDGTPWMTIDQIVPNFSGVGSWWAKTKNQASKLSAEAGQAAGNEYFGQTQVYKWRAPDGSWRYSDKPPVDQSQLQGSAAGVETIYVDPNTNMIQGLPEEPEPVAEEAETAETPAIPLPMTVSPTQAKELINEAHKVKELMEQRNNALEGFSSGNSN